MLKSLALPDAKQGEMLANFSAKQKWQLIKLNKARVDSQAMAAAMGATDGLGTTAEGGRGLTPQMLTLE